VCVCVCVCVCVDCSTVIHTHVTSHHTSSHLTRQRERGRRLDDAFDLRTTVVFHHVARERLDVDIGAEHAVGAHLCEVRAIRHSTSCVNNSVLECTHQHIHTTLTLAVCILRICTRPCASGSEISTCTCVRDDVSVKTSTYIQHTRTLLTQQTHRAPRVGLVAAAPDR
jgi:hypothetical protein